MLEKIMKYVFIIIGVVILEWIFLAFAGTFFNSGDGVLVGAAFFLSIELIICTGIIISKIDKTK